MSYLYLTRDWANEWCRLAFTSQVFSSPSSHETPSSGLSRRSGKKAQEEMRMLLTASWSSFLMPGLFCCFWSRRKHRCGVIAGREVGVETCPRRHQILRFEGIGFQWFYNPSFPLPRLSPGTDILLKKILGVLICRRWQSSEWDPKWYWN